MRKVLRNQPRTRLMRKDHLPQASKKRATSATAIPAETNPSRGILDELAERLGNFHESVRALASCLQEHDVSRKTDQSMIEAWYTCQSYVWLDDVKMLYPGPMRCVIVVHPLLTESAFLSCATICIDDSGFSPDLHKDNRVTLDKRQKNEISFVEFTDQHQPARQNDHVHGDSSD